MNSPRFKVQENTDNTHARLAEDFIEYAYAASVAITTKQRIGKTTARIAQATGALTLTAGVGSSTTDPRIGDELMVMASSDGTGRVITFSTGFAAAGTLTMVANKKATATFVFDGVAWIEKCRSIGA